MTWTLNTPTNGDTSGVKIAPTEVLYHFNEPLLYVSRIGFADIFFYKLEDVGDNELFLACPASKETIGYVKSGQISLRGALLANEYWILEARNYTTTRSWTVRRSDIPEDFLPEPEIGLFEHFGRVPDVVTSSDTFLSVKFAGSQLSEEGLPFTTFKELVDGVYNIANKIFRPNYISGPKSSNVFDFQIAQPQFSSLLLTIMEPVIDVGGIRRRIKSESNTVEQDILDYISAGRDNFITKVGALNQIAERSSDGLVEFIVENSQFAAALMQISPTLKSVFSSVEFTACTTSGHKVVRIDRQQGERIRLAHEAAGIRNVTIRGIIIEVNSPRRTFIFRTSGEREVTCAMPYDIYDHLERNGEIVVGAEVRVRGDFSRRVRRDYIWTHVSPEFV